MQDEILMRQFDSSLDVRKRAMTLARNLLSLSRLGTFVSSGGVIAPIMMPGHAHSAQQAVGVPNWQAYSQACSLYGCDSKKFPDLLVL